MALSARALGLNIIDVSSVSIGKTGLVTVFKEHSRSFLRVLGPGRGKAAIKHSVSTFARIKTLSLAFRSFLPLHRHHDAFVKTSPVARHEYGELPLLLVLVRDECFAVHQTEYCSRCTMATYICRPFFYA